MRSPTASRCASTRNEHEPESAEEVHEGLRVVLRAVRGRQRATHCSVPSFRTLSGRKGGFCQPRARVIFIFILQPVPASASPTIRKQLGLNWCEWAAAGRPHRGLRALPQVRGAPPRGCRHLRGAMHRLEVSGGAVQLHSRGGRRVLASLPVQRRHAGGRGADAEAVENGKR